jgi:hypothetical protein
MDLLHDLLVVVPAAATRSLLEACDRLLKGRKRGSAVSVLYLVAGVVALGLLVYLFVTWLVAVLIVVGALDFFPALALGPVVEHPIGLGGWVRRCGR